MVGLKRWLCVSMAMQAATASESKTQIYMANAITFKKKQFYQALYKHKNTMKFVHRLDGPYSAARYEHDPRKEGKVCMMC